MSSAAVARVLLVAVASMLVAWTLWSHVTLGLDVQGGSRIAVAPKAPADRDAALELVRNVVDEQHIEDAAVHFRGDEIVVELPGGGEREVAALEAGLQHSTLEIRRVRDEGTDRTVPVRDEMLEGESIVAAADLIDAKVVPTAMGEPQIVVTFTPDAGARFEAYTAAHVGERLAIVLDGVVLMAPLIREKIAGGTIAISMGQDNTEDPQKLARRLRSSGVAVEVTSRFIIDAAADTRLGLPLLRLWAGAGLALAILAALRPRRFALVLALALVGPLLGQAALLTLFNGTFTSMAYFGALCAVPAAVAIVMSGLRVGPSRSAVSRLAHAWPGWLLAGATFVVACLAYASTSGPPKGAATFATTAAVGVALLGILALVAPPRVP